MNAIGAYVQSVFASGSGSLLGVSQNGHGVGLSGGGGEGGVMGFYFRGSLIPLVQTYQPRTPKSQL